MYILASDFCTNTSLLRGIYIAKLGIDIIKVIIPIILIITAMLDLTKAVASEELMKKIGPKLATKIIAALLVFLVPAIISSILNVNGFNGDYQSSSCWSNANMTVIKELQVKQDVERLAALDEAALNAKREASFSSSNDAANKMVAKAVEQIGKDGSLYQYYYKSRRDQPWCAMFTSWVSEESGIYPTFVSKISSSTETLYNYFKTSDDIKWQPSAAKGGSSYEPKPGDYVLFNYQGADRNVSHIGIIETYSDGRFTYIHGNSGGGHPGTTKVSRGSRSLNYTYIVGYASWY